MDRKRPRFTDDERTQPFTQKQKRDDTLAVLDQRFPSDFEYHYDTEYFKVLNLGTNRIANLHKLCDLLTDNSVRFSILYCCGNSIHYAVFSLTHFFRE
jgi:hypothetical protein